MSASKLKNLIILILALACAFLLALVVPSRMEAKRRTEEAGVRLDRMMREANVSLTDRIPDTARLYAAELTPKDAVYFAVSSLLGEQSVSRETEEGTEYSSQSGVLTASPDGCFSAELSLSETVDPQEKTQELLSALGVRAAELSRISEEDAEIYVVTPQLFGVPVFDCPLCFIYRENVLRAVTGVCLSEKAAAVSGGNGCCTAQDALIAFWGSRLSLGWVGGAVSDVTQGYLVDGTHLFPVWKITTDTGEYTVNGITKTISGTTVPE